MQKIFYISKIKKYVLTSIFQKNKFFYLNKKKYIYYRNNHRVIRDFYAILHIKDGNF